MKIHSRQLESWPGCQAHSPTGRPDVVHFLPLQRLLDDPDFRPDVASFQQQLQRALPGL